MTPAHAPPSCKHVLGDGDGVPLFERKKRAGSRTPRMTLPLGPVEEHRGAFKLVEDEQERAEQEDEELHRNLQERIGHQTEAAFAQRGAADVSLHLRLVGAEIREREKQTAEQAGPKRVAPGRIERKIHRV